MSEQIQLEALEGKSMDDPVTRRDLQKAHKELLDEWHSQYNELKSKFDPYIEQFDELPADFQKQWEEFNERIEELEVQKEELRKAYERAPDDPKQGLSEEERKEHEAFFEWMKKGQNASMEKMQILEEKSLTTDSDVEGGYLVPENVANDIIEKRRARSPIRSIVEVVTISEGSSFKMPKEGDKDFEAGWTGERETRSETQTADFEMLEIPVHELYAKPTATRQMLADTAFDMEAWMRRKVSDKFARVEGNALLNGDGQNKPEGILTDPNDAIESVVSGASSSLTYQGLLNLVYDIEIEDYVRNAMLLLNRKTLADIRGLTDDNNMPIWQPGISDTDPPSIMGFPYETATDMPTVSAGANAIIFGDFEMAYTIVDRQGMNLIRDPYSSKPFIEFEWFTRMGGQITQEDALRFHEIGT